MLGLKLVTVSAEGRVEHQKLNEMAAAIIWLSFWCSTWPLPDTVTNEYRAHYHQLAIAMLKSS